MTHWSLANIEMEGRGESFILAALAGLLGHTGFLPSTVSHYMPFKFNNDSEILDSYSSF